MNVQAVMLPQEFTFNQQYRSSFVPELQRLADGRLLLTAWEFPANIVDGARTYADQSYILGDPPLITRERGRALTDCTVDDHGKLKSWVQSGTLSAELHFQDGTVRLVVKRGERTIHSRELMKLEAEWVTVLRLNARWYCEQDSTFYTVPASPKDANSVLILQLSKQPGQ